jgi:hypothetical protein
MADTPDLPLFSPAFAEHLHQTPPEFLYHYTGQDGLLGIIDSASLWATNISYMNDATEFDLSVKLLKDCLYDKFQAAASTPRKQRANVLYQHATKTGASFISVACFCENGDLLSQWRGYAGTGYGYSLAFIPSKLNAIASDSGFMLGKCIYDPDLQKKIIADGVEYLLTKPGSDELAILDDYWAILIYGAFFKHASFEQEEEWRLVSTRYAPLFRKGKSMIIPYTPLTIEAAEDLAIGHAIVGPCPHMSLSVRAVGNMLRLSNIDVEVYPSAIPFRDW